jgi:hypothetical protein
MFLILAVSMFLLVIVNFNTALAYSIDYNKNTINNLTKELTETPQGPILYTKPANYESLEGSDGTEEIFGQTWWYSPIIHISILNNPPDKPDTPIGPDTGKPGVEYTYSTKTFDPNGDQVYYKWSWGDGTESDWLGPYSSGETIQTNHTWSKKGTYMIKVKAKDTHEAESPWSDILSVKMPLDQVSVKVQKIGMSELLMAKETMESSLRERMEISAVALILLE